MTELRNRLNNLLNCIDRLLDNNLSIRHELLKLTYDFEQEAVKPDITDILGIKVYLGKDYKEPTEPENIKIGEEISPEEAGIILKDDFVRETIFVQDCAGNLLKVPQEVLPSISISRCAECVDEPAYYGNFCKYCYEVQIAEDRYLESLEDAYR